jgi:polysaccharide deacetylase family protein (PEP-CTERM system associated)
MTQALDMDPIRAWHRRPYLQQSPVFNAMTIDVEDYFHVEAFFEYVRRDSWDQRECRVEANTDRILTLLSEARASATFFTLGWVAKRYPQVVRRIVDAGHELASHGLSHHRANHLSREQFTADALESKKLLEDIGGVPVNGYRATSFSITRQNLWALNALQESGYLYSSSTFPIVHDLYGIPDQPRFAFHPFPDDNFVEIPVTTVRRFGRNWPAGGGGYFRLLPYLLSRHNMQHVRTHDHQPCCFYFHPWEIDPKQPRISDLRFKARFRHYLNLDRMQPRLKRLLNDFKWASIGATFQIGTSNAR